MQEQPFSIVVLYLDSNCSRREGTAEMCKLREGQSQNFLFSWPGHNMVQPEFWERLKITLISFNSLQPFPVLKKAWIGATKTNA